VVSEKQRVEHELKAKCEELEKLTPKPASEESESSFVRVE